ncbi:hypothetical protein VW29_20170 [Devosia limi DSM 17137]|nr:hypothetical protein VW29_20170 [Devosia limi DSM 17137]
MVRLGASLVALLGLVAPTWAGDRASIDLLGFSEDGRYFAFEEFGIQDGSGFAYASIYLIDLDNDRWVAGTPIKVQADTEQATLHAIRSEALAQFAGQIEQHAIHEPAEFLAVNGDGVPEADGSALRFAGVGFMGPGTVQGDHRLALETFALPSAKCEAYTDNEILGFALSVDGKELHRDTSLPASRGCALAYRIYGVAVPYPGWSIEGGVALISVYPHGFEGPDRRFLAVPLGK